MIKKVLTSIIMLFILVGAASNVAASSTPKIIGPDLIQKQQNQVLTISDILVLYSSNVGEVFIQEDDFTGNGAVIGIYEIELIASNGSEQALKTIEIQVLSLIGYKVRAVTDQVNIHISKANKLSPIDIVNVHNKTRVLTLNSTSQIEVLSDDYTDNNNTAGTYLFEYRIMDASGLDKTVSSYITVYDSERLENPITVIPPREKSDLFKKIGNTITSILILATAIVAGLFAYRILRRKKS